MDYSNRMYYWELEEKYNIHFKILKKELKGKGQDGITAAQKRKLWALGVNVTGVKYKGTACEIIKTVLEREHVWNKSIFRVKKIACGHVKMSPEIFETLTDAEYYAARRVNPSFDVEIIEYKPKYVYALVGLQSTRYFPTLENATFYQSRMGGNVVRYTVS